MRAGGEGELHGVFQGLLDNSELEVKKNEKMVMWYEEGEKRSRSEG